MAINFLKVKIKSLAAEQKIIRAEELKRRGKNWGSSSNRLREHRVEIVRPELRASHLAYGYLRGTPYHSIEGSTKTPDAYMPYKRVARLVCKYGTKPAVTEEMIKEWTKNHKQE